MASYQPGDIVRLKSGGPNMTVQSTSNDRENVWCVWFDAKGEHNRQMFNPLSLEPGQTEV